MVNIHICYKSEEKDFIINISFNKLSEYLLLEERRYDKETGEISYDGIELAVDNEQIIALRDFLNGLKLRED